MTIESDEMSDARRALLLTDCDSLAAGTGTEPTMTPGVFYHGSQRSNIAEFKSQYELDGGGDGRIGIYFTQVPTHAAGYAMHGGVGGRTYSENVVTGRIYSAELVTRNAYFVPPDLWADSGALEDLEQEQSLCVELRDEGCDCIAVAVGGFIWEAIVFDKSVIRFRDPIGDMAGDLPDASAVFYSSDGVLGPDYADDVASIFSHRKRAAMMSGAPCGVRAGRVYAERPIYCERATWPHMDFEVLRTFGVELLIDPTDGEALVLDRDRFVPMSRTERRMLLKTSAPRSRATNRRAA